MKTGVELIHRWGRVAPFAAAAFAIALSGCESVTSTAPPPGDSGSAEQARPTAGFAQFSDLAVPPGAKMDVERTLVLGARDAWIGRLAMTSPIGATEAYDFVLREMPKFGWQEITTVRSEVSVQTYSRGERIATVQISTRTLGGSQIDITVSPRGRPEPAEGAPSPR